MFHSLSLCQTGQQAAADSATDIKDEFQWASSILESVERDAPIGGGERKDGSFLRERKESSKQGCSKKEDPSRLAFLKVDFKKGEENGFSLGEAREKGEEKKHFFEIRKKCGGFLNFVFSWQMAIC